MSGMEPLLIGAVVAGTATTAVGHEMAGQEASRAAAFETQQLDIQAQSARTAADQSEARRREELTSQMETIQALRAGRGVGSNSPGGEAILTSAIDNQERDIAIERSNYMTKADLSRRASELSARKAQTSLLAGDLSAAGDIFSSATKIGGIYGYPSTRRA